MSCTVRFMVAALLIFIAISSQSRSLAQDHMAKLKFQDKLLATVRDVIAELVETEVYEKKQCKDTAVVFCHNRTQQQKEFAYFACGAVDTYGFSPEAFPFPAVKFAQLVNACRQRQRTSHRHDKDDGRPFKRRLVPTKCYLKDECRFAAESVLVPLCTLSGIPLSSQVLSSALDIAIPYKTQILKHNMEMDTHRFQSIMLENKLEQSLKKLAFNAVSLHRKLAAVDIDDLNAGLQRQ